jgi:hypothetical protein
MKLSVALVVLAMATPAWATRADLAKARTFYNQRKFDDAIEAATAAQKTPATLDAATVVLARAHLERYRERADPADLGTARTALGTVRAINLDPKDRLDFLLALGEALFFEDDFGAAAKVFESGLDAAVASGDAQGEAMLDWWGSAIERHADTLEREGRTRAFAELTSKMTTALVKNPASAAAGYWVVVGARGSGDPHAAWDAAVASWVRARLAGERSAGLRADLDKLVLDGILIDRAAALPADQREQATADWRAEWELVKQRWK